MSRKPLRTQKGPSGSSLMTPKTEALLTEGEAARFLKVEPRTLQAWRLRGDKKLPHVRISKRCVRYRPEDVRSFVEQRLRYSTSDTGENAEAQPQGTTL